MTEPCKLLDTSKEIKMAQNGNGTWMSEREHEKEQQTFKYIHLWGIDQGMPIYKTHSFVIANATS